MTDDTCGGVNPMANMMKQFSQDRSHQRDQFIASSSSSGPSSMRTQRQPVPMMTGVDMVHEFFGQEQQQQYQPAVSNIFKFQEHPQSNWTDEFEHHKVQELTASERQNMEQIYSQHHVPTVWRDEFLTEREFESAFQHHSDWTKEFDSWDQHFAQIDQDDIIAKQVELAATQIDFDHVWDNIQNELENNEAFFPKQQYAFYPNNPFLTHSVPLTNDSSVSDAVLAFEAAVQKDPLNSEAWMQLGLAQSQNEQEESAILALEKSVDLGNVDALMALAVSYTNESIDATKVLEQWISRRYPQVMPANSVAELFLRAAREAPEKTDPDVQVGLGVLFFKSQEFDKAVDCFASALKKRPNDCLLWNRMGAVLASQDRVEEAIEAYHKALQIRPTFVRARYNLALAFMRTKCYKEAAEHILSALSLSESVELWDTLRKTLLMMGRRDLCQKAIVGADVNQFRQEFEFN